MNSVLASLYLGVVDVAVCSCSLGRAYRLLHSNFQSTPLRSPRVVVMVLERRIVWHEEHTVGLTEDSRSWN